MIQRIQSLYLLLTTIASALFLTGDILKVINTTAYNVSVKFSGIYRSDDGTLTKRFLLIAIISVLVPVISGITIFLFKNRKLQGRLILINLILEIALIAAIVFVTIPLTGNPSAQILPGFRVILPVLCLILLILGYRGIKKDDELVKSYDRLR
jgi:peptidoglycan/LPS O-acetylase OafA/YrhL